MAELLGLLPFVPSGKDFEKSRAFFKELGFEELRVKELERRFPGVRMKPPTAFPWGREAHLIDLAGVCWHFGRP